MSKTMKYDLAKNGLENPFNLSGAALWLVADELEHDFFRILKPLRPIAWRVIEDDLQETAIRYSPPSHGVFLDYLWHNRHIHAATYTELFGPSAEYDSYIDWVGSM
jgi:lysine/ornithine N-monooxygenase